MTIISFIGIFAGLGVADVVGDAGAGGVMVLGVFLGSALWWLTLSAGVSLLRHRFTARWMLWVNRLSGLIILGFAVAILGDLLF
jgi:arginine exporter protein ArgO